MDVPGKIRRRSGADDGVTMIELMIVVIVLGILAAIAVPVYLGVQDDAKDSAVRAELVGAKTAVIAFSATNERWSRISGEPSVNASATQTSGAGGFKGFGWASAGAVDASSTAGGSPDAFCIKQRSASSGAPWFYVTEDVAPTSAKPAGCV